MLQNHARRSRLPQQAHLLLAIVLTPVAQRHLQIVMGPRGHVLDQVIHAMTVLTDGFAHHHKRPRNPPLVVSVGLALIVIRAGSVFLGQPHHLARKHVRPPVDRLLIAPARLLDRARRTPREQLGPSRIPRAREKLQAGDTADVGLTNLISRL